MRLLAFCGAVGAFLALALTAALGDPYWRWSLVGMMACISLTLLGVLGLTTARLFRPDMHLVAAGIAAGLASALTRRVLMAMIRARAAHEPPHIDPMALLAAVFTLVGGAAALLWGCSALRRLVTESEDAPLATVWRKLVLAGAAITLGLYGISPLGQAVGIRVNHWTFLGLVGLALVAYAIEEGVHRALLALRLKRGTTPPPDTATHRSTRANNASLLEEARRQASPAEASPRKKRPRT